jgi:hypothetical protein
MPLALERGENLLRIEMGSANYLPQNKAGKTLVAFSPRCTFTHTTKLKGQRRMTKKNEETKTSVNDLIEKATLKWRLSDKPTLKDVESMLDKDIINKDEAREMLFSLNKPATKDEQVKALEEQVEFLKTVVEKIANKPPQVVWGYINTYTPTYLWSGTRYVNPYVITGSFGTSLMNSVVTAGSLNGSSGTTTTAFNANNHLSTGSSGKVVS